MSFSKGFQKTAKVSTPKHPKLKLYVTGTPPSKNPNDNAVADGASAGYYGGNA